MMDEHARHLDGNAAAGALATIFAREMTLTATTCGHCGNVADIGALRAYITAIGTVLRCATCDSVVLRMADTPEQVWLDFSGMRSMVMDRQG
jgi:hypothetical protein